MPPVSTGQQQEYGEPRRVSANEIEQPLPLGTQNGGERNQQLGALSYRPDCLERTHRQRSPALRISTHGLGKGETQGMESPSSRHSRHRAHPLVPNLREGFLCPYWPHQPPTDAPSPLPNPMMSWSYSLSE